MTGDIRFIETGNGGDVTLRGNDLDNIGGLQNMPYLAWFGGNVEQSTPTERPENTEAFDFWGNALFEGNNQQTWFNSLLERTLKNTSITPQGIRLIEVAAKKDLEFMRGFANVEVVVSAPNVDRVLIALKITEIATNSETIFSYIWSATNQELTPPQSYEITEQGQGVALPTLLGIEL
jgi:hypothetical protein